MAAPTPGCIQAIAALDTPFQPVVQVLEVRSLSVPAAAGGAVTQGERFKLKISDGTYFMQAMLTTNHNNLVYDDQLKANCFVRLMEYVCNSVQDKKICIIVDVAVVAGPPTYGMYGNPISVDTAVVPAAAPVPTYAPVAAAPPQRSAAYGGEAARGGAYGGYGGGGAVVTSSEVPRHVPIATLNPYSNKWTIKVRVTSKGERRTWSNAKGEGSLFSADLLDQYGTMIRATWFKEGVDRYYDVIQKEQVYFMSGGKLKAANKKFSSINNDYEINFDQHATIVPAPEDVAIKHEHFSFVAISSLESTEKDAVVDVIGIAKDIGAIQEFRSKAGKDLTKRDITLVDASSTAVTLTVWGDKAAAITDASVGAVLAVKGARVGDFGGRSISTTMSSNVVENPKVPEADKLRAWWESSGSTAAVTSISNSGGGGIIGGSGPSGNAAARKTFGAIKGENLGSTEEGDIFTVKGTVNFIKHDGDKSPWYPACVTPTCSKKAIQAMAGSEWTCEKCNISFPQPNYRYILTATAIDHTGQEYINMFNDQAVTLLDGHTASEMARIKDEGPAGQGAWSSVFQRANFRQYLFRLKAKREPVGDNMRLKVSVLALKPIEYGKESKVLLDAIKQYGARA